MDNFICSLHLLSPSFSTLNSFGQDWWLSKKHTLLLNKQKNTRQSNNVLLLLNLICKINLFKLFIAFDNKMKGLNVLKIIYVIGGYFYHTLLLISYFDLCLKQPIKHHLSYLI